MLKAIHFLGSVVLGTTLAGADWMDDSGYAELLEYLQVDSLPDNTASLEVDIIEAQETSGTYMPEAGTGSFTGASTHFLGHSFQNVPSLSSSANSNEFQSSHANAVGQAFFSVSRSYAPSLSTIYVNEANDFINGLLSSSFDLSGVVANLSWIVDTGGVSDSGNVAAYAAALQRFDYIASTGNTLVAVGLNNGTSNADGSDRLIPELWAPSYNALSVGVVSGNQ